MKMMIRPAKITHSMLLDLAKRAREDHERTIFLHYTWGRYGDVYDEYHLCIDKNGEIYRPRLSLLDRIDEWACSATKSTLRCAVAKTCATATPAINTTSSVALSAVITPMSYKSPSLPS